MSSKVSKRPSSSVLGISRSIAACKRCRLKKIKCDHKFPSCTKCLQSQKPCVSIDPATGRDIPRSYVVYLEDKVLSLIELLEQNGIDSAQARNNIPMSSADKACDMDLYDERSKLRDKHKLSQDNEMAGFIINNGTSMLNGIIDNARDLRDASNQFANIGKVKQESGLDRDMGEPSASYLGDSSGISFAKMMFTAVKFRPDVLKTNAEEKQENKLSITRDDFTAGDALSLPSKSEAEALIASYFTRSNAQIPVLHRELFLEKYFKPVYGDLSPHVSWASDHTKINYNFQVPDYLNPPQVKKTLLQYREENPESKTIPKEYHSALFFLNIVFAIGVSTKVLIDAEPDYRLFKYCADFYQDILYSPNTTRLEALQGSLLMSVYCLMRPTVPGLWYTLGSSIRLCVDLGLHAEKLNKNYDPFMKDLRRRLFWCCYSLDRQVCAYFGRPVSIPDVNITTSFPSPLDDALIGTVDDTFEDYSDELLISSMASYKTVCLSMFQIRKIQSEVVQVMYAANASIPDEFMDLEDWRISILNRLDIWFQKIVPKTTRKMNCSFPVDFFALNYHYTKHILYGLSPKCPILNNAGFIVVYESAIDITNVNYKLTQEHNLNYTWVGVHNVFMCGMTYLYVIYHSSQFDETIPTMYKTVCNKILFVLESLFGKCDAARNCHKIFKVMSQLVLKLKAENLGNSVETLESPEERVPLDATLNFFEKDSLDQFLDEMDKLSPQSDSASQSSLNKMIRKEKEAQSFIDLVQVFSADPIWGEFFSNGTGGPTI